MVAHVTVLTPVYNAGLFIESFVNMLEAQSFSDWVCLFIDDGSTDNTNSLIQAIALRDDRFSLIKASRAGDNQGPGFARNIGIKNVETPLIAFCDVDDIWHPRKLETQLKFHSDMNIDISFTAYARFISSTDAYPISYRCPPRNISYRSLLGGNPLPLSACIVSHSVFLKGYEFPTVRHEDFALWLDIFKNSPAIRYATLPLVLMFYRIHGANVTSNRCLMLYWTFSVFRHHGLGLFSSCIALLNWVRYQLLTAIIDSLPAHSTGHLPVSSLLAKPPLRLERVVKSSM